MSHAPNLMGSEAICLLCLLHPDKAVIPRLKEHCPKAGAQALVLAPTRELVIQLHKAVKELARYTDLRLAVLVGGDSMEAQFAELAANPDIILATPGQSPGVWTCLVQLCEESASKSREDTQEALARGPTDPC